MSEKAPQPMTIRPSAETAKAETEARNKTVVKTPVETLKHTKAFEYYYSLGDERTLTQVGKKFKVSGGTLGKWSAKFKWGDRVQARDKAIGVRLKYESDKDTTETRRNILKIIRTLVTNALVEDEDGNVKIKGIEIKSIAELQAAYALTEMILNPGSGSIGDSGKGNHVLVQIQK